VRALAIWFAQYRHTPRAAPTDCDNPGNAHICEGLYADVTFVLGCLVFALIVGLFIYLKWDKHRRRCRHDGRARLERKLRRRRLVRRLRGVP
jgi:hypothetical protein